jgi:proline racemase
MLGWKVPACVFCNVLAFVMHRRKAVEVPGLGKIMVDVAYGGMI